MRRLPRQPGPELPKGELLLESPPILPEAVSGNFSQLLVYLPMVAGAGAMAFLFTSSGGGAATYLASSMYALSSIGMMVGMLGRTASDKRRRIDGERRDYLRYLSQVRGRVRTAAARQRAALTWRQPHPAALWSLAVSSRLWERRPADDDFGTVRVATGSQRLAVTLIPPDTQPAEDLDPVCAAALRDLITVHSTVPDLPVAIALRSYAHVTLTAALDDDRGAARGVVPPDMHRGPDAPRDLARAILGQLATFHSPDELQIAVCASRAALSQWSWLKWLPHAWHPSLTDGAGRIRLVRDDLGELEDLLGSELSDRPRFGARPEPGTDYPHVVVVYDGGAVPPDAQLVLGDVYAVTLIDLTGTLGRGAGGSGAGRHVLALRVGDDQLIMDRKDDTGTARAIVLGRPDRLGAEQAEALARVLAPLRTGPDSSAARAPLEAENDLPSLLGIADLATFDQAEASRQRVPRDRLRVAIGLAADAAPVELDLKESAQGGMGPHGLVIGATGSGKSELLRTLVTGLAMTHTSEALNFVLVDFKGGATFLGLEALPHTSAIITNLADELPLVDRMQDALRGELVRRQELLRSAGNYTSVYDYERARAQGARGPGGALLDPLPTLLIVVDEFSELLTSKPEFIDLFVAIGRLGRSLAVHLLLASQRLEEGRLRGLDTHLSYRICLRTFSAMESRIVLGVPDAYELPTEPGSGFLKFDVTGMTRFRSAYVSGPYRPPSRRTAPAVAARQIMPFPTDFVPPPDQASPSAVPEQPQPSQLARVFDVAIERIVASGGAAAHRVWLPPLGDPPTLDELLPRAPGRLCVPVGIVDRPFEQRRDPFVVDLSGAGGHAAVVGATRTGKSTLLRTLIAGLAMTHTPEQVQFYCLDFGGGGLAALRGLPHVGGVCNRLQADVVRRTVAEVTALLEEREADFARLGIDSMDAYRRAASRSADVFLVVDGWGTLRSEFDLLETAITKVAARGLAYGVHVIVASNRWAEIRAQLKEQLATRLELRLGEPFESEANRRTAANVPENAPGRGLTRDAFHFLGALPRVDGKRSTADLADGVADLVGTIAAGWAGPRAPAVRLLPAALPHADLIAAVALQAPAATGTYRRAGEIPFGIAEDDLGPVAAGFGAEPHFLVFGDTASGKSNLLRVLADGIVRRHSPAQARLIIVDYRRSLLEAVGDDYLIGYAPSLAVAGKVCKDAAEAMRQRLPAPDVTSAQLRDRSWWHGPDLYLLVDDYDLVAAASGNPLAALLDILPHSRDIGLHVIVARASGGAGRAVFEPVLQRLRELGTPGVLLSGSKEEGSLLGNVAAQPMPPGRGNLVHRGQPPRLVQVALLPS